MGKDYTDALVGMPKPLILERWPESGLEEYWERAQQFALVLDEEGDWLHNRTWLVCGDNSSSFDELHHRIVVVPILDSRKCACEPDVPRLERSLRPGGVLATKLEEIELGRTLTWDDQRREQTGELDEDAVAAIEFIAELTESKPFHTSEKVMTVTEHLLGLEKRDPPRDVMRRYGLRTNSSEKAIMKATTATKEEFQSQRALAYGSYSGAVCDVIEREREQGQLWLTWLPPYGRPPHLSYSSPRLCAGAVHTIRLFRLVATRTQSRAVWAARAKGGWAAGTRIVMTVSSPGKTPGKVRLSEAKFLTPETWASKADMGIRAPPRKSRRVPL